MKPYTEALRFNVGFAVSGVTEALRVSFGRQVHGLDASVIAAMEKTSSPLEHMSATAQNSRAVIFGGAVTVMPVGTTPGKMNVAPP